jgi:hypothetical protein
MIVYNALGDGPRTMEEAAIALSVTLAEIVDRRARDNPDLCRALLAAATTRATGDRVAA